MKIFMFVMLVVLLSATVKSKTEGVPVVRESVAITGLSSKLHAYVLQPDRNDQDASYGQIHNQEQDGQEPGPAKYEGEEEMPNKKKGNIHKKNNKKNQNQRIQRDNRLLQKVVKDEDEVEDEVEDDSQSRSA